MISLSNRQVKAADRVGGIELMVRWPSSLPQPVVREGEDRPATPAEFDAARALLDPGARNAGIAIKRVTAACLRRPRTLRVAPDAIEPHLAVWLVGFRWFDAEYRDDPPVYWYDGDR